MVKNNFSKEALYKEMDSLFEKYRLCKYLVESSEHENKTYRAFCDYLERLVQKLPDLEKEIIQERYMKDDYVYDINVYKDVLYIAYETFDTRRLNGFKKIDAFLKIHEQVG